MSSPFEQNFVYVVRFNVDDDRAIEFDDWYVRRHGPDVVRDVPGFAAARSYRVTDGPQRILSIYDISDPAILVSDEYTFMRSTDAQGNSIRATALSDSTLCIYSEVARAAGTVSKGRSDVPRFTSADISTLRFDLDNVDQEQALIDWFASPGPAFGADAAALGSYLCRHAADHPKAPSTEPQWIVVTDWLTSSGAGDALDLVDQVQAVVGKVARATLDHARRVYEYQG
ncbi:MAG: hypothetical protein ACE37B_19870 [Ilumatobacter sp.]|uniref:hypothetical protein n=1 Tax=Ilumatobacter sp. TaxID=1967498 RepID=UPI00391AFD79